MEMKKLARKAKGCKEYVAIHEGGYNQYKKFCYWVIIDDIAHKLSGYGKYKEFEKKFNSYKHTPYLQPIISRDLEEGKLKGVIWQKALEQGFEKIYNLGELTPKLLEKDFKRKKENNLISLNEAFLFKGKKRIMMSQQGEFFGTEDTLLCGNTYKANKEVKDENALFVVRKGDGEVLGILMEEDKKIRKAYFQSIYHSLKEVF